MVRRYDFSISRGVISPDGYNKSAILINNQYPGPTIEANWGDTFAITVTNNLEPESEEGLSMHWHGIRQQQTPWFDGVPGVSQCPIAPGKTFTYTFQADQFGTSWYHSHYSAQYTDGVFGPMIIYGPLQEQLECDCDLGPVILTDYIHQSYYDELVNVFQIPPAFPTVDNNIINGKGCSLSDEECVSYQNLTQFSFVPGLVYRLRLINAGGAANQKFSIDNHVMTIIANDFVPVQPYNTTVVTLGIGQRTDVLVRASGKPTDAVYMRSDIDLDCLNLTATNPHGLAVISYPSADLASPPNSTATSWQSNNCRNDALFQTQPYYPLPPPSSPSTSREITITLGLNATGHVVFFVDSSSFRADYNLPTLLLASAGNTSYPSSPEWNIYNFGSNSSVRIVVKNTYQMQHPMHLHGHNFWVLNEGIGDWDGHTVVNPDNPQRRDTHILQPGSMDTPSFAVFEWEQDNPGIWPFHCHTSIHVSAGLYINVMVSCSLFFSSLLLLPFLWFLFLPP